MIIDVKATRQAPAETDPAQRYLLKSMDKKSRTPLAISLLMASVILYLKSIFSPQAQPAEEADAVPDAEPEGSAQPLIQAAQMMLTAAPAPTAVADAALSAPPGSGRKLVDEQLPVEFMLIESPVVDLLAPKDSLGWRGLEIPDDSPVAANPVAANDNAGPDLPGGVPPGDGPDGDDAGPGDDGPATSPPASPDDDDDLDGGDPGGNNPGDSDDGSGNAPDDDDDSSNPDCSCGCEEEEDEDENTNRAPRISGPVYLMDLTGCAILTIGLMDLLQNAYDPDGDALSVENLVISHGLLTELDEGWLFQGGPQLEGLVTITYDVTDGALSISQTAYFSVSRKNIQGTDADDTVLGTMCADDIDGGDGDDNIDAHAGNDTIVGGAGDDHIVAGSGDDIVFAGSGDDIVFAGIGDDIVFGGTGNDRISGGDGNDRLYGEAGDDIIFGDAGDDRLMGGAGDDILQGVVGDDRLDGGEGEDVLLGEAGDDMLAGGAGDDTLQGGTGDDRLDGGDGDDVLIDGAGADEVLGGAGNDHVIAALDATDDQYDGGEGCDTLDYSLTSVGVTVDLIEGTAQGTEIGEDSVASFEEVVGGSGDDHFIADAAVATVLSGGEGCDVFEFVPDPGQVSAPVMHEILDFEVGDRVRMSKYDLFEKVYDELEDRFGEIYGDDFDEDDVPIRYRHDRTDDLSRTIIEADFNDDDVWETTIALDGHRILIVVEQA